MTDSNIDALSRRFNHAAGDLAEALIAECEARDPELMAKVAQALAHGERLLLALEFNPAEPAIRLATLDDYQRVKQVMSVPAKQTPAH